MKKILRLCLVSVLAAYPNPQAEAQENWSAGIRGGIVTVLGTPQTLTSGTEWVTSGAGSLFVQRAFGKQQRWMVEIAGSYHQYGRTLTLNSFPPPGPDFQIGETYHTFSVQLSGRYALIECKRMNWKHYAGVFVDFTKNALRSKMFEEGARPATTMVLPGLRYFAGVSYFGKFDLTRRLNAQYQLGYGHEIPFFSNLRMSDAPDARKVFFHIGIGYTF